MQSGSLASIPALLALLVVQCSEARLSHAASSGYLVVYAFGAPVRYLEMQYLVQRDKGCELRHKGSVLELRALVKPI